MRIACPVCRAENEGRACRRCKADLGLIWDLEARRATLMTEARARLGVGDVDGSIARSRMALQLRADGDAMRTLACAHLLAGRHAEADVWRRRAEIAAARHP